MSRLSSCAGHSRGPSILRMTKSMPVELVVCGLLAFTFGCADVEQTSQTASAVTDDLGETSLVFRSPQGYQFEIRSVTPPAPGSGPMETVTLSYGKLGVRYQSQGDRATFKGSIRDPNGLVDPVNATAAYPVLAAVLLGQATTDQFTSVTGLTLDATQFEIANVPPPHAIAVSLVQQTAGYVLLKDGPVAGALANSYIASLGMVPCPGPSTKGL
jgi:hypothetical protein